MKNFSFKRVLKASLNKKMLITSTPVVISLLLFFIMYNEMADFPAQDLTTGIIFIMCLFVVFIAMPILTLLFAFIPEKYLPIKWNIVSGLALSNFLWILFMFVGISLADMQCSKKEQKFLDKHNLIIEELYKQKKQYSLFPSNLSDTKLKPENDGIYSYEVKDSGKDFILSFDPYQSSNVVYVYCSSNVDKRCEESTDTYTNSKKLKNGWIKIEFTDD